MRQRDKVLYILSIIFLAIAVGGGAAAVTGFFLKNSMVQFVGAIIMIVAYACSAFLDFFSRRKGKNKNK